MRKERVQDPLRALSDVFRITGGNSCFNTSLEQDHQLLSEITLDENVPIAVRQLFETAKNLSLYSWFVYRFHQVSEMVAFAAMEMALRERYLKENPPVEESASESTEKTKKKSRNPSLGRLLQHARNENWIRNDRFSFSRDWAYRNAQEKKMKETIASGILDTVISAPVAEPTEKEIEQEMEKLDIVDTLVTYAPQVRNDLAHGSTSLGRGSINGLLKAAEVINQICLEH
jgi:hypothetical protein